jgi:hypothetical protein
MPVCASAFGDFISNLSTDFSATTNTDTSTFSYRYRTDTNRNGDYALLPIFGPSNGNWTPSNPGAWNPGGSTLPEIGMNQTGTTVTKTTAAPHDSFSLANGSFWMRPAAGQIVVLSWLYPFDSQHRIDINYSFADIDVHGGDGVRVYYEERHSDGTKFGSSGSEFGSDGVAGGNHVGGQMGPGDRFDLILDPQTDASFDATSFTLTIVPEPNTVALAAIGFVIFAAKCRARARVHR